MHRSKGDFVLLRSTVVLALLVWVSSSVKINIVHTTDIHGWVAGHSHNATLDADFGDFHSLLLHLRANAIKNNEEFFLFDTGDLIEGTGMSDATPIHGQYIFEILKNVSTYNALTMGNHDIGHDNVVELMQASFIPFWNGTYLTANSLMAATQTYIGDPFVVFTTTLGTKVLVLGYLFNFTHAASDTVVVPVSVSLTQPYFQKAMQIPDVDLIVVCSHIAPQYGVELPQIYQAIRKYHATTPLVLLSGHSHVTDFQKFDANAFTLESGKYFEVIGVIGFELLETGHMRDLTTSWLPTSVQEFITLSKTTASTFPTKQGKQTSQMIQYYYALLGLNITYGCAPATYYNEVPYADEDSVYRLFVEEIVPKMVFIQDKDNIPFFITNPESIRYNLYAGPVTRNDLYSLSPFNDTYVFYGAIPGASLKSLLHAIANTSGLMHSSYCGTYRPDDGTPNWYMSPYDISLSSLYDLVLCLYDAETILPVVQKLFPDKPFATFETYPTPYNSTGSIQAYVETKWPCS